MPLPLLIPLAMAGGGALLKGYSDVSAERQQHRFERDQAQQQEINARRNAIQSLLGYDSHTTPVGLPPLDLSGDHIRGAIGGIVGNWGASMLGNSLAGVPPAAAAGPQAMAGDPSEAIRRKLMQSANPYGGYDALS